MPSRDSRDSRDSTNCKIFVTSMDVPAGKGNRVNAVNPVNVGGATKVDLSSHGDQR